MGRSEVQRNPRDPLCKLVDRLDRLSMKEKAKGDGEEKDLLKAPPSGRGTPCFADIGEFKEKRESLSQALVISQRSNNFTLAHHLGSGYSEHFQALKPPPTQM